MNDYHSIPSERMKRIESIRRRKYIPPMPYLCTLQYLFSLRHVQAKYVSGWLSRLGWLPSENKDS